MKVRDSGMPEEVYWDALFNVPLILDRMKVFEAKDDIVALGTGLENNSVGYVMIFNYYIMTIRILS
ncbi:hypothetical protein [Leptospira kmetyi]|uniref:hypothetical protein n=1 Tax=Leptospira kmetyi TaxID=408139 RepID=UPI001FEFB425|nr:hypothetical protein [Leptospira kmetyi]